MLIVTPPEFSTAPASGLTTLVDWALSSDGEMVVDHGQCVATLLPHDAELVLVLPPRSVSWHRVTVPKVPQAKLRAVLSDTAELHYALEPRGRSGQTLWVAACQKEWLVGWLQSLERAGRPVSRVVPALWPLNPLVPASDVASPDTGMQPTLHWAYSEDDQIWLATASPVGVRCTPLRESAKSTFGESSFGTTAGGSAPALDLVLPDSATTSWLADPAVAATAERSLGHRFELVSRPSWLLQCALSEWNLAQFALSQSPAARRSQRWRRNLRRWRSSPQFRAARWGLGALLAVQLVGLNAV
ncbi:MAG: type II secretion system protein GspL, partial [Hydrogenophaga sp.]